jgi:hypothetical protein
MLYVLCYMKIKNLISVKIEIFFSHTYYMYIFRLFLSYIVLNRSFLYIFVTNIHIYQHGLTPRRVAEAPGPRALRAGRQEAEAPGPALCRPVAIHERLGVGRAGSQPAPPSTNLGVTGHPGPAAEARLVMSKKLAHIYTRLDAAPGGSRSADPWPSDVPGLEPGGPAASQHRPTSDGSAEGPCVTPKPKNL